MKKSNLLNSLVVLLFVSSTTLYLSADDSTSLDEVKVVTTASGFEQNIADAPASISVITSEELKKKAYSDVIDAVKNIPGVSISGGGNNQDVVLRGMGANYTKYLINGVPVSAGRTINTNGTDGGKVANYLPPIDMIERIEVVRGPMSSLYGSDAMGGVINIITKKTSNSTWRGSVSAENTLVDRNNNKTSNDRNMGSIYLTGPIIKDNLSLTIDAMTQTVKESDYQGAIQLKSASSESEKSLLKSGSELKWNIDQNNDLSLRYDYTNQKYISTPGKSVVSTDTGSTSHNIKQSYLLNHSAKYDSFVLNTYYKDENTNIIYYDNSGNKREELLRTFNTQGSFFIGNNSITTGIQYQFEKVTDSTNKVSDVTSLNRWLMAVYAEDEYEVASNIHLTAGIRYNHDEYFKGYTTPRLYGVYHITSNLSLKGGVSTGYKQPSLTNISEGFGLRTGQGTAVIVGNPNLKPEKSISYEAGLNYSNNDIGLFSSLMFFQTDFKDKIVENRLCETPNSSNSTPSSQWICQNDGKVWRFVSKYDNIADSIIRGIEYTLDYNILESLKLSGSYTFNDTKMISAILNKGTSTEVDLSGNPLNKIPKHSGNVSLSWDATKKLNIWTQYNYRGKTSNYLSRTSIANGTPSYATADLGFAYKVNNNLNLKAGIYNIANKEIGNDDYDVVLPGRRFTIGMNATF